MRRSTIGFLLGLAIVSPLLSQRDLADALARTLAETLSSNELELIEPAPVEATGILRGLDSADFASAPQLAPTFDQDLVEHASALWISTSQLTSSATDPPHSGPWSFPAPLAQSSRVRC